MKNYIFFLVFTLFASFGFAQNNLEYNLSEGQVFTIKQDAQQTITQELDGASHEIVNKINGVMQFEVVGEKDENYEVDITFKDLKMNMTSSIQGELLNVNATEVVEGDMQSQIFNSLLNVPVRIILAKTGDILEVNGGDSLVSKMASASGLGDEFSINMMKKSLEKEFGSEALSNSYKQMTYIYPNQQKIVGDTWENEYTGKLSAKNTWTLDAVNGDSTNISGAADVTMNVVEPATTMTLTGTQQTTVVTDVQTGFILKMTVEGLSKGSSTMTQMGDQEIPTTIKSTITYELITE